MKLLQAYRHVACPHLGCHFSWGFTICHAGYHYEHSLTSMTTLSHKWPHLKPNVNSYRQLNTLNPSLIAQNNPLKRREL